MSYLDWGFRQAPFQTSPLPPNEQGQKLLVGRDDAVKQLMKKIEGSKKIAIVEGLNGIGKTSIVNVASYNLFSRHLASGEGDLFVPCRKIFQLDIRLDAKDFAYNVLLEVAQTLIEQAEKIKGSKNNPNTAGLDRWLNHPQLSTFSGGIFGAQFGVQTETNTAIGFERSGFVKAVGNWLSQVFPNGSTGGVVCTIDNLELLQSSDIARDCLEQLRDEIFNTPGLRWVLCGSLGITYGVVNSPRLEGYLHHPIEVKGIGESHVHELLQSRIEGYAKDGQTPYLPITLNSFERLHQLLRGNLRSVLHQADEFCQSAFDTDCPDTEAGKDEMFNKWLSERAERVYEAAKSQLRKKPLEVFLKACEKVVFGPGEFSDFGFSNVQAMRPHIRDLESANLLVSARDDVDQRRKTIQVTGHGWLVKHHLDQTG